MPDRRPQHISQAALDLLNAHPDRIRNVIYEACGGGYGIVSEAVLDAKISDRALRVYAHIVNLARLNETIEITTAELAKKCGKSSRAISGALRDLREAGLLRRLGTPWKEIKKGERGHRHVPARWAIARSEEEIAENLKRLNQTDTEENLHADIDKNFHAAQKKPAHYRREKKKRMNSPLSSDAKGTTREKNNGKSERRLDTMENAKSQKRKTEEQNQRAVGCDLTEGDWARLGVRP